VRCIVPTTILTATGMTYKRILARLCNDELPLIDENLVLIKLKSRERRNLVDLLEKRGPAVLSAPVLPETCYTPYGVPHYERNCYLNADPCGRTASSFRRRADSIAAEGLF